VVEYCYFFEKHSLDLISLEIVNRHSFSYVHVQDETANAPVMRVKRVRTVNGNPDSYSDSCLCERSLKQVFSYSDLQLRSLSSTFM